MQLGLLNDTAFVDFRASDDHLYDAVILRRIA
jgi:hypothetical protein